MADGSAIEWTDASWNPVRGCTKVSPGCKNCYAEVFAERFRGTPGHPYEAGFDLRLVPERLSVPLGWRRPRRIFVDSMSDLFQQGVSDDYIARVFEVMVRADWHTYQILTKRSERLRDRAPELPWPEHVWMGVSVERADYVQRIDHLRATPAAVRFLSLEPLLGPLPGLDLSGIDWLILGGESGHAARLCELAWMRDIVAQARQAQVPVFVKQLGLRASDPENGLAGAGLVVPDEAKALVSTRLQSRKGGALSEWPEDLRIREWPRRRAA